METVAKFYFDEKSFPKLKASDEALGQIVDCRFNDLLNIRLPHHTNYQIVDSYDLGLGQTDPLELLDSLRKKEVRALEILEYQGGENKSFLKEVFSSILFNKKNIFPYRVSCKNKKNYSLLEEIFKEKGIGKNLSSGLLGLLVNTKLIS